MSRTLSLFVFIDAFGWEILSRSSFMEDELPVRVPLRTELGYSSTCDPTILTGLPPREHGHFTFYYHAPERSPFRGLRKLRHLPRALTSRARVRNRLSRWVQRKLGYTGYFALYNVPFEHIHRFDYSEKKDLYEPGGILGGQTTVFDDLRVAGVEVVRSDWRQPDDVNLASMADALETGRPRAAYLYLAGMDGAMHQHGTRGPHVDRWLRTYEEGLRKLLDVAGKSYSEVRMHVFSDHGMADVTATLDLKAALEEAGLEFGSDYVAALDSTMARFWFLQPDARRRVTDVLRAQSLGRVLSQRELEVLGCDFEGDKYGELFFLVDPGVLITPSHMGERPCRGMHGYHPLHAASTAMYATNQTDADVPGTLRDLRGLMNRCAAA